MNRCATVFTALIAALMGMATIMAHGAEPKVGQIKILTIPCAQDAGIKPSIEVTLIPSVGSPFRETAVKATTTELPSGEFYSRLALPAGQYLLEDYTANCRVQPLQNLTIVNGVTRHLFLQTVHDIVILRSGLYGIAVELPTGIPAPLLENSSDDSHPRRAIVDGNIAYIHDLDEGRYTLLFPFHVFPLCKQITFTNGKPASMFIRIKKREFISALKRAEKNGQRPGTCQGWL